MKNLENKYIDLANFYKHELVRSNQKGSNEDIQRQNRSQGQNA